LNSFEYYHPGQEFKTRWLRRAETRWRLSFGGYFVQVCGWLDGPTKIAAGGHVGWVQAVSYVTPPLRLKITLKYFEYYPTDQEFKTRWLRRAETRWRLSFGGYFVQVCGWLDGPTKIAVGGHVGWAQAVSLKSGKFVSWMLLHNPRTLSH